MTYVTLYNAACWHLRMAENADAERDRTRHAAIADRLFILAYLIG